MAPEIEASQLKTRRSQNSDSAHSLADSDSAKQVNISAAILLILTLYMVGYSNTQQKTDTERVLLAFPPYALVFQAALLYGAAHKADYTAGTTSGIYLSTSRGVRGRVEANPRAWPLGVSTSAFSA